MDYQGQKLAELLYYWIIIIFGVSMLSALRFYRFVSIALPSTTNQAVGWIWGYFERDFMCTFNTWAAGVIISVVVSTLCIINLHAVRTNTCDWLISDLILKKGVFLENDLGLLLLVAMTSFVHFLVNSSVCRTGHGSTEAQ